MRPGDRVRVTTDVVEHEGILMPSSTTAHLVIKGNDGYNVGIERDGADVEVLEAGEEEIDQAFEIDDTGSVTEVTFDDDLPEVALISTGGTIASTVDYRTGAVSAQFDAEDVLRAVPELAGRANYRGRVVANVLSENMTPEVWVDLANAVYDEIERGVDGVVVMHGTDTMQYTAAALSFMLDTPIPVVLTGSQRSADRPSSDNVMNAVCAVEAATADIAGIFVCMHATESDDRCSLHLGTRVRKDHTSRRDAFETVGNLPVGTVEYTDGSVRVRADLPARGSVEPALFDRIEPRVEFVKFVPGLDPGIYEWLTDRAGVVIEGTGLGHVHTDHIEHLEALVEGGTTVVMTSQCLEGRVCDRVYDTGRDLLDAGVIEAGDTLPETAYVKLMWALANVDDIATTMREPIAGELTERSVPWT